VTNNVFWTIVFLIQQQQNRKSNILSLARAANESGTSRTPVACVTSGQPSQLRVSIVVKVFNCFKAIGRNVKKAEFAGHTFATNLCFL